MRTTIAALGVAALAALGGCSSTSYFLVSSQFVSSTQAQAKPEVIASDAYRAQAARTTTVALRAPDTCANNSADQSSGSARSDGVILHTNCGVEMAEIEKSLARVGYNVISWNVMAREMRGDKSAAAVAQSLGADVIFQVNSLEKSKKTLGQDARWERKYFHSNPNGAAISPLPLSEEGRSLVRRNYLADVEKRITDASLTWAVTLDATAVWVGNGQSIWYYRWTLANDSGSTGRYFETLLACEDGVLAACSRSFPQRRTAAGDSLRVAGESEAVSVSEKPEDRDRAVWAALLKDVIDDFVTHYAEVRHGAPPVAAAPVRPAEPAESAESADGATAAVAVAAPVH